MNLFTIEWAYLYLVNGRLVESDGIEFNPNIPSFESVIEAEVYLEEGDIRATIIS